MTFRALRRRLLGVAWRDPRFIRQMFPDAVDACCGVVEECGFLVGDVVFPTLFPDAVTCGRRAAPRRAAVSGLRSFPLRQSVRSVSLAPTERGSAAGRVSGMRAGRVTRRADDAWLCPVSLRASGKGGQPAPRSACRGQFMSFLCLPSCGRDGVATPDPRVAAGAGDGFSAPGAASEASHGRRQMASLP